MWKGLRQIWDRYGVLVLIGLFVASLVPVLLLGRYDRASADDYSYGIFTYHALHEGGDLLKEVWHTATGYYHSWQGTFTALAMMSLAPCIFSEGAYWITPVVMLAALIVGTLKLGDTLIRRCLGGSWRQVATVCIPVLFLSIQCVKSPLHTFYWWNGSVYYTFTYGMMLLMVERLLALALAGNGRQILGAVIPGILYAVLVGGSNYVSNLLGILVGGLFLLWFLFRARRKLPWALLIVGAQGVCFLISALAPGNGVRQDGLVGMGPLEAIGMSILQAGYDGVDYLNWPILLTLLALIPVLWGLTQGAKCAFRWPAAFSLFSFLLFAAQNTPHFYAASWAGPYRLRSIVFYAYFWLLLSNLWYWLGWIRRALLPRLEGGLRGPMAAGRWLPACLVLAAMICVCIRLPGMTAGGCVGQLRDGSAAAFAAQHDGRLAILLDQGQNHPRFAPIQAKPAYLFYTDITQDPRDWKNNAVAAYFHKGSVAIVSG